MFLESSYIHQQLPGDTRGNVIPLSIRE